MDNLIMEFLSKSNARIDNGDKWLVANEVETCYVLTVYKHVYKKRLPIILYQGLDLENALQVLNKE